VRREREQAALFDKLMDQNKRKLDPTDPARRDPEDERKRARALAEGGGGLGSRFGGEGRKFL
jgi:hypothetical protein